MILKTVHLGEVHYDKENVISFKNGLPGFEEEREFIIVLSGEEELPFHYLQSVTHPEVAFVITDPFLFVGNYDFELTDEDVAFLKIEKPSEISVYSITTIPDNLEWTSINLAAPVIVNNTLNEGKQVILDEYPSVKYYIFNRDEKGDE